MTSFPRCSTTKEHIVWNKQTYHIKHIYNIHKNINSNVNLTKIKWKNNPYIGWAYDKMPYTNYNQQLYYIIYTNITIQTQLYYAQTYHYKRRYNSGEVAE